MKACILESPGAIVLSERAEPVPGPGEVRLRVRAALTCGTDLKTYRRGHPRISLPAPLGHEFAGEIDAVGPGVTRFVPGQAVMGVHTAPCGSCGACRRGRGNLCDTIMERKVLGAFAEKLLLPAEVVARNLYDKPESISFPKAAFLEPLACVLHGLAVAGSIPETALVLGAGPIGLLHVMLLARSGCRVFVAGRRPVRLEAAREAGAEHVFDVARDPDWPEALREAVGGVGVETVIECTGAAAVWRDAPNHARSGGSVVFFGGLPAGARVEIDATRLHYEEITLRGVFHFTPGDVRAARDELLGGFPVDRLISDTLPLSRTAEAMERLDRGEGIKYCIEP